MPALNARDLLEGIWTDPENKYRFGIVKAPEGSAADYVAVILQSGSPIWQPNEIKLRFGPRHLHVFLRARTSWPTKSLSELLSCLSTSPIDHLVSECPSNREEDTLHHFKGVITRSPPEEHDARCERRVDRASPLFFFSSSRPWLLRRPGEKRRNLPRRAGHSFDPEP